MLNRGVVSIFALLAALLSVAFCGMTVWWTITGRVSEGDAVFMLGGWLLAAVIFGSRSLDPEYLDPISIVKGR